MEKYDGMEESFSFLFFFPFFLESMVKRARSLRHGFETLMGAYEYFIPRDCTKTTSSVGRGEGVVEQGDI